MANLPLAFAELLAGGIMLTAGIKDPGGSIANVIRGLDSGQGIAAFGTGSTTGAGSSSGAGGYVNPLPGASASRVDQGVDYTGKRFLALGDSKILTSRQTDPGWAGGGYVSGQLLNGPYAGKVWYMAEGLSPLVNAGDIVTAGQTIARPVMSPFNGIIGNIEAGWANPSSPGQPLARSTGGYHEGDSTAAGSSFNRFIQSLGGPLGHLRSAIVGDVAGLGLP